MILQKSFVGSHKKMTIYESNYYANGKKDFFLF